MGPGPPGSPHSGGLGYPSVSWGTWKESMGEGTRHTVGMCYQSVCLRDMGYLVTDVSKLIECILKMGTFYYM